MKGDTVNTENGVPMGNRFKTETLLFWDLTHHDQNFLSTIMGNKPMLTAKTKKV